MLPPTHKPRSVKQVELYLDRLAAAARRASTDELRRLLPLVARLTTELEAAKAEERLLEALLLRSLPSTPNEKELSE